MSRRRDSTRAAGSLWDEVRRINARGTTVFLTTQYLEEADALCDRIAIIDGGRIVRDGTPSDLKSELQLRRGLPSEPSLDACSSTRPDAPANASQVRCRRFRGERHVGAGPARVAGGAAHAGRAGSDDLHSAVLPRRQRWPGCQDLPVGVDGVPQGPGYFDKLRVAPVSRTAIVLGRLVAEAAKSLAITALMIVLALVFGVRLATGPAGFVLLLLLTAGWAVVFAGVHAARRVEDAQRRGYQRGRPRVLSSPLSDANFVPRDLLTRPMEIAATLNPVTYIMEAMRSFILDECRGRRSGEPSSLWPCQARR